MPKRRSETPQLLAFDLLLRTGSIDTVAGDLVASEGSVELF